MYLCIIIILPGLKFKFSLGELKKKKKKKYEL